VLSVIGRPIVDIGRPRGVGAGSWVLTTDEAAVLVLLVEERELRVLAGGEVVGSVFPGPWMMWVIFALGLNMGVVGVMTGERVFEGTERGKGCCGGERRVWILAVEPTLAVRAWINGEGWANDFDLTRHELLVMVPFGRGGEESSGSGERC